MLELRHKYKKWRDCESDAGGRASKDGEKTVNFVVISKRFKCGLANEGP